jgi:phage-related protein
MRTCQFWPRLRFVASPKVRTPVEKETLRPVRWMSDSRRNIRDFPEEVKDDLGAALQAAQRGRKHNTAKPLHGFGDAQVLEIVEDYESDTYRVVYTVRFPRVIYVLHAFKKKSKRGNRTPKSDAALIKQRLKDAIRSDDGS